MAYTKFVDLESIDHWAIDLVVNEGVRMNLSMAERLVAVRKLKARKMSERDIADRLHVSVAEVEMLDHRLKRLKS